MKMKLFDFFLEKIKMKINEFILQFSQKMKIEFYE